MSNIGNKLLKLMRNIKLMVTTVKKSKNVKAQKALNKGLKKMNKIVTRRKSNKR